MQSDRVLLKVLQYFICSYLEYFIFFSRQGAEYNVHINVKPAFLLPRHYCVFGVDFRYGLKLESHFRPHVEQMHLAIPTTFTSFIFLCF